MKNKNQYCTKSIYKALNYLVVLTAARQEVGSRGGGEDGKDSAVFHWHWLNTNGEIGMKQEQQEIRWGWGGGENKKKKKKEKEKRKKELVN